jgi:hypothetical protein
MIHAALVSVCSWLLREIVVKFIVFTALFSLVAYFVPYAIRYLLPFLGVQALDSAFSGLPSGILYFLDFFAVDVGVSFVISAYISRFLIRRLPVIG